jgi:hypothetical protein
MRRASSTYTSLHHPMHTPSEGLTQLLDKVMPFHSEIVKSVNTLIKLAASRNKRTLEEADDEGGDDREEDGPKKKGRFS